MSNSHEMASQTGFQPQTTSPRFLLQVLQRHSSQARSRLLGCRHSLCHLRGGGQITQQRVGDAVEGPKQSMDQCLMLCTTQHLYSSCKSDLHCHKLMSHCDEQLGLKIDLLNSSLIKSQQYMELTFH